MGAPIPAAEEICPFHNKRITADVSSYSNYPDDGYGEPTNTDLSTQEESHQDSMEQFADEAVMRFLRAHALVPQPEYGPLSVQTLPSVETLPSQNTFELQSSSAKSLGSADTPSRENCDIIERYTSV